MRRIIEKEVHVHVVLIARGFTIAVRKFNCEFFKW